MKKLIKIFALVLFILLVLGITTSNAGYSVGAGTTATQMLEQLNKGNKLTGISDAVRDQNPYLFCREHYVWLYSGAQYSIIGSASYPGDGSNNGHAKAYILAAPGYVKSDSSYGGAPTPSDERQWAWYAINGEASGNDLYNIALGYQAYKNTEKDVTITNSNAKTSSDGNNVVYGPVKIEYSYGSCTSGSKSDEWGGFNYAFFDEEGTNISDKLQFCTLENNEYKPITSTKITSTDNTNGYYKVRTANYNSKDLYMVTSDKKISTVIIKIQENEVNYTATIYELDGTIHISSDGTNLCTTCRYKITNSLSEAIGNSGALYSSNGSSVYTYSGLTTSTIISSAEFCYNRVNLAGTYINYGFATKTGEKKMYLYSDGYYKEGLSGAIESWVSYRWDIENKVYKCTYCGKEVTTSSVRNHVIASHINSKTTYTYQRTTYNFASYAGCGAVMYGGKSPIKCGSSYTAGDHHSQGLLLIDSASENKSNEAKLDAEIELAATIEVTKKWEDYDNLYNLRPEILKFNVFRSTDQATWEKLTEGEDYTVEMESKKDNTWKVLITGLVRVDDNGKDYYFKVEEQELVCFKASYPDGNFPEQDVENPSLWYIDIENSLKDIKISGYVWLDGQTGIKPVAPNNGIMDDSETRMKDIVVYLYYKNSETGKISKVDETVTDENGHYEFKDHEIGYYYVEFYYDGVHYENTISGGSSKAFEKTAIRNTFNGRFQTITYKKSNDGTTLNYEYADKKSTLITNNEDQTTIKQEFQMTAESPLNLVSVDVDHINLGLVKRGTDIALSTDVYDAKVIINGQSTDYIFNKEDNSLEIGTTQTSEKISYNLNLYASDYNYRIRDYVNTQDFKEKDYINDENSGIKTGDDLKVYVIYELNLQNQSTENTRINEIKYTYDEKYMFAGLQDSSYSVQDSGNVVTVNLNGLSLSEGQTKTIYLVFEVKETDNAVNLGDYSNKAEITSYSTDKGLIDVDSQPGNFVNDAQIEDDCDTAGGLTIVVPSNFTRTITGKVFDENGNNVNDVIVQLIELKPVNGKVYEYIWQETVSGTNSGLRLNADGTALETYSYTETDGYYEFKGFIPGDYIVRFIYGDGTTYDMTGNVIKYNGQDYKSVVDANYKAEWYNSSSYIAGASVARDNEARRLETMAYSVEIDASKGVLLKLLNNLTVDDLNETEKEVIISTYKDIYGEDITEVTSDVINKLLKEQTLKNTWMCAETSKIKVPVDTTDITNTSVTTTVNGINTTYANSITNINFGLELRPVTQIELKKYITGFKLIAANGQTLVNAYIDVNEYLNGTTDISNKVQGVKDNVTILSTVWQYEVVQTDINTIVDGASLEFEYTLVVRNTGEDDYLSTELANAYNTSSIGEYKELLAGKASDLKTAMRSGTYRTQIGNSVGTSYYTGESGTGKVLTEVTNIRDYVNNDLTFVFEYSGKVDIDESASHTHRLLREDWSIQEATINTILKTTESTGKMDNSDDTKDAVMYTVTLGKNPISSTGNLSFDTYIAEVMNYTNAAGRRAMTSTPGNAEIVDSEQRTGKSHEIDEADTGRIQVGVATGDDQKTNYIIIIAVAGGIALIAIGAYVIKKYFLK